MLTLEFTLTLIFTLTLALALALALALILSCLVEGGSRPVAAKRVVEDDLR